MSGWWQHNIVDAGKLPLMISFVAFVLTFAITRTVTRLIRAGRGPFKDRLTSDGVHVHHAVPGLILLILGAFTAIGTGSLAWRCVAAFLIGTGVSLVLDEFALILHLSDDYWSNEGRLSVDLVSLAAGCLGLALVGFSPSGVDGVGTAQLAVRVGGTVALVLHGLAIFTCILKRKYRLALIGLFLPPVGFVGAVRIARPESAWARHRYNVARMAKAERRAEAFDRRYDPLLHGWLNLIGGAPSLPDPTDARPQPATSPGADATQERDATPARSD
jgi:hypothetical protein